MVRRTYDGGHLRTDCVSPGMMATHLAEVMECAVAAADYVEQMLATQLVDALGKELGPRDFDQYLQVSPSQYLQVSPRHGPISAGVT